MSTDRESLTTGGDGAPVPPVSDPALLEQAATVRVICEAEADRAERQRYEREMERRDRARLRVETAALVGVALAVGFTFWQVLLTRQIFITDQRPWLLVSSVSIKDFKFPDVMPKGELVVTNLGKSPAFGVRASAAMSVSSSAGPLPPLARHSRSQSGWVHSIQPCIDSYGPT